MDAAIPMHDLDFATIRSETDDFHRRVRFANFWMIFAQAGGSALGVVFGWLTLDGAGWWSRLAILANVIATVWMIIALLRGYRSRQSDNWTLRSRLESEIEFLEKHRKLWSYAAAWLLAPMSVSVLLGLPVRLYWVWFALCALIYWMIRREGGKTTDPLLSRLKHLYGELMDVGGPHSNS